MWLEQLIKKASARQRPGLPPANILPEAEAVVIFGLLETGGLLGKELVGRFHALWIWLRARMALTR